MVEPSAELTYKLLDLMKITKYPIVQSNGQRKFGPPPDWNGPPPPRGCEVFVGKLPRDLFEDELYPIFSKIGRLYDMRMMMDFSGSNRGYAFVTYTNRMDAANAIKQLNGYEIKPGRLIGVVKSVDNCRLYVGGIPKDKKREEVMQELANKVSGIVDVILYRNCFDRRLNRGFAFVEFISHSAAAMARRALVPGTAKLWNQEVTVDWAEPEPDIEDDQMKKVKILYARNFLLGTCPNIIKAIFEKLSGCKVERVKKIYDYAFIHFHERSHAELALKRLQNVEIEGSKIEVKWAKPVDRDLYRIQKMTKGNAKFNNSNDFASTMALYRQHLEKKEYADKEDEGISSGCAGDSSCNSPMDNKIDNYPAKYTSSESTLASIKLESMCQRYSWPMPKYEFHKVIDNTNIEMWVCRVELPSVGYPVLATPQQIGPYNTPPYYSKQMAYIKAAEMILDTLVRPSQIQQTITPTIPAYTTVLPTIPSYGIYDYMNTPVYARSPVTMPIWHAA